MGVFLIHLHLYLCSGKFCPFRYLPLSPPIILISLFANVDNSVCKDILLLRSHVLSDNLGGLEYISTSSFARFSYSECKLRSLRSLTHMGMMRQGGDSCDNIVNGSARAAHNTGNLWQCCNFHKNHHPSLPPSLVGRINGRRLFGVGEKG